MESEHLAGLPAHRACSQRLAAKWCCIRDLRGQGSSWAHAGRGGWEHDWPSLRDRRDCTSLVEANSTKERLPESEAGEHPCKPPAGRLVDESVSTYLQRRRILSRSSAVCRVEVRRGGQEAKATNGLMGCGSTWMVGRDGEVIDYQTDGH